MTGTSHGLFRLCQPELPSGVNHVAEHQASHTWKHNDGLIIAGAHAANLDVGATPGGLTTANLTGSGI